MKLEVEEHRLTISPETPQDVVWIENVLGLKEEGDFVPLVRVNCMELSSIAELEAPPFSVNKIKEATYK